MFKQENTPQVANNNSAVVLPEVNGVVISEVVKDFSFEEFLRMCKEIKPKFFRVCSRDKGFNIVFKLNNKWSYFGRGKTFEVAFHNLIKDITERKEPKIVA